MRKAFYLLGRASASSTTQGRAHTVLITSLRPALTTSYNPASTSLHISTENNLNTAIRHQRQQHTMAPQDAETATPTTSAAEAPAPKPPTTEAAPETSELQHHVAAAEAQPQQPKRPLLALPAALSTEGGGSSSGGSSGISGIKQLDISSGQGSMSLDHLGPMVIHTDGTMSRIANWAEMADIERRNTLRVLGKRNQIRIADLRAEAEALPGNNKEEEEGPKK